MASRHRKTNGYDTLGSVAYSPAYDGAAVRSPRHEEELRRSPRPKQRDRKQTHELTRTKVEVREAGQVAPFAVVGFLAVAVFAMLLLGSYAQLTMENGEMVALRREMSKLQTENATLTAEYEKVFDMAAIQKAVGDDMVRPTSDQVVYIDLSEPDTVVLYNDDQEVGGIMGAIREVGRVLGSVIEYFR